MNITLNKKDFIWNMLGQLLYAFVSMFLSLLIINLTNKEIGGIFSFGYTALSQTIFTISYFGARNFHITDCKPIYNFHSYKTHRIITSIISILIGFIYVLILFLNNIYNTEKAFILILLVISGMFDGYFDVYECELQRINKLYLAGRGLFIRTLIFSISLIFSIIITNNIVLSLMFSLILKFLSGLIFEIKVLNFNDISHNKISYKILIDLTISLLPMFLTTFMDIILHSSQKFAIDLYTNNYYNGLYNILFMPGNIIYLMATIIMRPIVSDLSKLYIEDKDSYYKKTNNIIIFEIIFIIIIFVLSIFVFKFLYINLVNIMTNNIYIEDLFSNKIFIMFIIMIFGSCLYAISTPFYYFFIIENKLKTLLLCYTISMIISLLLNFYLIKNNGFYFSSLSYAISMLIWIIIIIIFFKNGKNKCLNTKS